MPTPALFSRARTPVSGLARSTRARLPEPSAARLRAAVTVLFVLDGAVFGSWAARVPGVAAQVGAGHTALGVALLCLSLGALVCMRLTGRWCARFGAGPVSAAAGVAVCLSALLPGLAGSVPVLCAALLVFGAATGMVNVAANALGVQVEARVGRPLLSGLHAGFSLGGLAGALVGGAAAAVLGVAPHLALVAAAGLAATAWALPALLGARRAPLPAPGPAPDAASAQGPDAASADGPDAAPGDGPAARRRTAALVVLGAVAGCTAFGEGALTDWGALLLREELGAPATLGALGYAGFASAMAGGRLAGGWLLLTLGERRLLAGGALLAAVGAAVAVSTPVLWVALAGFVVVGLGLSNVFPLAIARAGLIGGAPGIALATTVGYTGLLGGPPLIGLVAEHAGLPAALGSVALLALAAAFLVLTVVGDRVLVTAPAGAVSRRVTRVGERLQPVVSGFGHGTGVYVRELTTLLPSGGDPSR